MLIDVHAHLFLLNNHKPEVLTINTGLDFETNLMVLEFDHKNVLKAIGCHPSCQDERTINQVEENIDKVIAVGEIGLDFYKYKNFERQEELFIKMLEIAEDNEKPVVIHSRGAEWKVLEILKEFRVKFLMHSYTGPKKLLKEFLKLGGYFSIPSIVVRSQNFQSLCKEIPLDRIFFETDSPFMPPRKGEKNFPENVELAYRKASEIMGIEREKLEKIVEENFERLFGFRPYGR